MFFSTATPASRTSQPTKTDNNQNSTSLLSGTPLARNGRAVGHSRFRAAIPAKTAVNSYDSSLARPSASQGYAKTKCMTVRSPALRAPAHSPRPNRNCHTRSMPSSTMSRDILEDPTRRS